MCIYYDSCSVSIVTLMCASSQVHAVCKQAQAHEPQEVHEPQDHTVLIHPQSFSLHKQKGTIQY